MINSLKLKKISHKSDHYISMAKNNIINVKLFGREIGRIGYDEHQAKTSFQYHPLFLERGEYTNIFPKTGILKSVIQPQLFSNFNNDTFKGLPPQFADSLPDLFGSLIFKIWLDTKSESEITILEQLAYISNRGMGALEYEPAKKIPKRASIDLDEIVDVLRRVMDNKRASDQSSLNDQSLINIFKIGTSAGGARPKIIISKHKNTGRIIPGDLEYSDSYDHYLVKLSLDEEVEYPRELIEYCYYLTIKELDIHMMDAHMIEGKHFATKRYDRQGGEKKHVLTATGLTGWDYKLPTDSSYENLFKLCSFLKVPHAQTEELYKRMIFNVVFRNTDDHMKNHSFIYDKESNRWGLSPAYDVTFALNPLRSFKKVTRALSINNKRSEINLKDVLQLADQFTIKNPKGIIKSVHDAIDILEHHMQEQDVSMKVQERMLDKIKPLG